MKRKKQSTNNFSFSFFFTTTRAHTTHNHSTKTMRGPLGGTWQSVKRKKSVPLIFFIISNQAKKNEQKRKKHEKVTIEKWSFRLHRRQSMKQCTTQFIKIVYSCTRLQHTQTLCACCASKTHQETTAPTQWPMDAIHACCATMGNFVFVHNFKDCVLVSPQKTTDFALGLCSWTASIHQE